MESATQAQMLDLNAFKEWIIAGFGLLISIIGYLIRKSQRDQVAVASRTEHDQLSRDEQQKELLEKIFLQVRATNGDVIALKVWKEQHEKEVGRILEGVNREFEKLWEKVHRSHA